jgi:hypothetical protein
MAVKKVLIGAGRKQSFPVFYLTWNFPRSLCMRQTEIVGNLLTATKSSAAWDAAEKIIPPIAGP